MTIPAGQPPNSYPPIETPPAATTPTTQANVHTVDLGLPAIPLNQDPAIFWELVRIYNALNLLAQVLDTYTGGGTTAATITAIQANITNLQMSVLGMVSNTAEVAELRNQLTPATVLPTNAVDLPTAITLVNAIKSLLQATGIGA